MTINILTQYHPPRVGKLTASSAFARHALNRVGTSND